LTRYPAIERITHGRQGVLRERPMDPALPVSYSEHRQVDGEEEGREAGIERLRDQLVGDAVVTKDIDLEEPDGAGRGRRDLGRTRGRERRQAESGARGCRRAGHPFLSVGMGHPLVGDRRHDDR